MQLEDRSGAAKWTFRVLQTARNEMKTDEADHLPGSAPWSATASSRPSNAGDLAGSSPVVPK
jgi:hypothetical protein